MSSLLTEVESMDTLPFVVDSTPSRSPSQDKLAAPSINEVSNNPEELRTLRGQGRYFGVSEEDGGIKEPEPKCNNCSQRGHLKRDCPHIICTYCGSMDDHYSQHCPKAIKCSNCNESGHYRSQCPHKWKRVFCTLCNSKRHARDRCPSIWRVYILKEEKPGSKKKRSLPMHEIYCYNCGLKGHFGDDCDQRRSSRVPLDDGSAFSGENLSNKLKREYYNALDRQRRENSANSAYYDATETFDYDNYELDDSYYDNDNDYNHRGKNKKSKKRKASNYNQIGNQSKKHNATVQPTQRGKVLEPLEFPRSNNRDSQYVVNGMQNSRYGSGQQNNSYPSANYKEYNTYKPFKSGTIGRRR